jgi:uncharacterized protein (TIGR00730 family)
MDHIGIFCSSRDQAVLLYKDIIHPLMLLLYKMGVRHILYGGGDKGLMGVVYHDARSVGMSVTGHNLDRWSQPHLDTEIVYTTLLDRQNGLIRSSQSYLILPGGIGTIYELSQVLCHNDVEKLGKKVILYNYNHYYDGFIDMLKQSISLGMIDNDRLDLYIITNLDELKSILE